MKTAKERAINWLMVECEDDEDSARVVQLEALLQNFAEQVRDECAKLVEGHEVVHAGVIFEIAAQIRKLEIK